MRSQEHITAVLAALERVILGKPLQLKIALVTLLARGHLLIEDLPGMGKTTLAHALAQVLGLACRRMQFTADLLPADLLGLQIFDPQQQTFRFHPAPSSPRCCWRTRSTAPAPRCRAPCWRRWPRAR